MSHQLEYVKIQGAPPIHAFTGAKYGHVIPVKNLHYNQGVFMGSDYLSDQSTEYMQQQIIEQLAPEFGVRVLVDKDRIKNIARNLATQKNMPTEEIQRKTVDYIVKDFRHDQYRIAKVTEWERNQIYAEQPNKRYNTSPFDFSTVNNSINTTPAGRNHRGTVKGGGKFFSLK